MADRHPRKSGGERIVVGTKQNVAGIRAPVVVVVSIIVQGRGHFLLGDMCPVLESGVNVRSPSSLDAKLAGGGQMPSCRPSALD
eukprot:1100373-Pelagomonas_calceolata.AAC.1